MSNNNTTHGGGPPTFPDECQFDGTNFLTFRDRVMLAASLRGAEGYLDSSIEKPTIPETSPGAPAPPTPAPASSPTEWWDANPSPQEWRTRNAWTMALMVYNMRNPVGMGINMGGSAADAWKLLKDTYANISEMGAVAAENVLRSTKYTDGADFPEHIADLRTKWRGATERGANITDTQFWAIIISSLPESWNYIVAPLQFTKSSTELVAGLNLHWERLQIQHPPSKTTTTALLAKSTQKPRIVCINSNCKRTIKDCYWPGGGKEGQFLPNFGRRRFQNQSATPNTSSNTSQTSNPTANIANTNTPTHITYALSANVQFAPAAIYDEHLEAIDSYLSNVQISDTAYALRAVGLITLTYADSGASEHCFVNRDDFDAYTEYDRPRQGYAANKGGVFNIVGQGTVRKSVVVNGITSELVFGMALHTPGLAANLVSVGKFDTLGYAVLFQNGKAQFMDPKGRVLLVGEKKDNMYLLPFTSGGRTSNHTTPAPQAMVANSLNRPVTLEVWHRRMVE